MLSATNIVSYSDRGVDYLYYGVTVSVIADDVVVEIEVVKKEMIVRLRLVT